MIDLLKFPEKNTRSIGTQTEDTADFHIQLSKNKYIEMYKSRSIGDYVLSLNNNSNKKILITKSMWNIFRKNLDQIDGTFMASGHGRV